MCIRDSADTTQNIIWVVRAHDHHTAANNKLTHTMTLETKNVYSLSSGAQKAVQYDATEAFYYAEQELAAGTYNITISNQLWYTADNGKTFQFELTKALPEMCIRDSSRYERKDNADSSRRRHRKSRKQVIIEFKEEPNNAYNRNYAYYA